MFNNVMVSGVWFFLYFILLLALLTLVLMIAVLIKVKNCRKKIGKDFEKALQACTALGPIYSRYPGSFLPAYAKTKCFSSDFLTIENLIYQFLSKNKFSAFFRIPAIALPKLLSNSAVGFGILGTFVGFTAGISGFNTKSAEEITRGIDQLLSGMKTAFWTSIVGMTVSLGFGAAFSILISSIQRNLDSITKELDDRYFIDESEYLRLELSPVFDGVTMRPADAVKNIMEKLVSMDTALQAFSNDIATQLTNFAETFSEKTGQSMVEKFNDEINNLYSKFVEPHMAKLESYTKELIEHKKESTDEVVKNIVGELEASLKQMVDEFRNTVSGETKSELEALSALIKNAGSSFDEMPKVVASSIEELKYFQSSVMTEMQKVAEKFQAMATSIETIYVKEQNVKQLTLNLLHASERMGTVFKPFEEALNGLISTVSTAGKRNEIVSRSMADLADRIGNVGESYKQIDENLAQIFSQLQKGIVNYQNTVNDGLTAGLKVYSNSIENFATRLSNAAEELNDGIKELNENLSTVEVVEKSV